jgi:nucleoside-diphosphate-sugar epimerase
VSPRLVRRVPAGRALVTGCAGFIGSHLCEQLVLDGWDVTGVDCFTPYYERELKEANLWWLRGQARFALQERDLAAGDVPHDLLEGIDVVFHLAAQAGVRRCYGTDFDTYVHCNIVATQRLLEACVGRQLRRFVYASSSSVYGHSLGGCTNEEAPCLPVSPYGVTKLATEALATTYARESGVPAVGLRYFSVYGPRQRPDMAFTAFLQRAVEGLPITLYGDGRQERDWTYVDDVVAGTIAAVQGRTGAVYNIGGGTPVRLTDAITLLELLLDRRIEVQRLPRARGDAARTAADGTRALLELGFRPQVTLHDGLRSQLEWIVESRESAAA